MEQRRQRSHTWNRFSSYGRLSFAVDLSFLSAGLSTGDAGFGDSCAKQRYLSNSLLKFLALLLCSSTFIIGHVDRLQLQGLTTPGIIR